MTGRDVLAPEAAYIGSMLWLPASAAQEAHGWLTGDDIGAPALRLVHQLIGDLTAAGVQPDPVTVYSLATYRELVVGEHHAHVFTGHLCRLYDHRATNPPSVRWYALGALDDAIRRRTVEMADRLRQVAAHADVDELARLTRSEQDAIDAIRARRRALEPEGPVLAA